MDVTSVGFLGLSVFPSSTYLSKCCSGKRLHIRFSSGEPKIQFPWTTPLMHNQQLSHTKIYILAQHSAQWDTQSAVSVAAVLFFFPLSLETGLPISLYTVAIILRAAHLGLPSLAQSAMWLQCWINRSCWVSWECGWHSSRQFALFIQSNSVTQAHFSDAGRPKWSNDKGWKKFSLTVSDVTVV